MWSMMLAAVLAVSWGSDREPKVLIIGVDGLLPAGLDAANAPSIRSLMRNGCWTMEASTDAYAISGAGWSNILCGVWPDKHRSPDNSFRSMRYDLYPHVLRRLSDSRPDLTSASITSWGPLDEVMLGNVSPAIRVFHDYEKDDGDVNCTRAAVEAMGREDLDLMFLYYADVDTAGHTHGFSPFVPEYVAEIEEVDGMIGRVLSAMLARPTFAREDWLVILTTDHGGSLDKNHGKNEASNRQIPFIVSGASAARGRFLHTVNQVDVVATTLEHLGVRVDPAWGLDSVAVGKPRACEFGQNLIVNGGAEWSTAAEDQRSNAGVPGWKDWGSMTTLAYGGVEGGPKAESRGPVSRGRNYFCGGAAQRAEMEQAIDLRPRRGEIEAGGVEFEFSGWFGGYGEQRDLAYAEVVFADERGVELSRHRIGPVTLEDRIRTWACGAPASPDSLTGLIDRTVRDGVPPDARMAVVRIVCEAGEGLNDGYADELSLVLAEGATR